MESEKYSWQGYLRQDGRCGIRNHILVIYTVKCSEFVARKIVENSDDPDVDTSSLSGWRILPGRKENRQSGFSSRTREEPSMQ